MRKSTKHFVSKGDLLYPAHHAHVTRVQISLIALIISVFLISTTGVLLAQQTRAFVSYDVENAARSGNVATGDDTRASGSKYVQFNASVAPAPNPTPTPTPTPAPVPSSGEFDRVLLKPPPDKILLGAEAYAGGYAAAKQLRGKELHVYHTYARSGSEIKNLLAATPKGTIPLINFKPGGTMGPNEYKAILAGSRNSSIKEAAAAAKAYGKRFFFSPMHEPENDDKVAPYVGDADYAKAYKYVIDMMKANGANNIVVVWNMMGAEKWMGRYNTLYPGDNVVDWIASDPYSHKSTDSLNNFHSVKQFYAWASPHNKPMMWAEWGLDAAVGSATGTRFFSKAGIDAVQQEMPLLKAMIYWNEWEYVLSGWQTQWSSFSNLAEFDFTVPSDVGA